MITMKLKYMPGALVAMALLAAMLLLTVEAQPALAQTVVIPGLENDAAGHLRAPGQIMVKFKSGINLKGVAAPDAAPPEIQTLFARLGVKKMTGLGGDTNVFLLYVSGPVDEALKVAT